MVPLPLSSIIPLLLTITPSLSFDLTAPIPECYEWTGIASVYDSYCSAVGCSSCNPLAGNRRAFRKCVLSQPLCVVPGWSAQFDPRCRTWSGLVPTYDAWCREQECPKCVTSEHYEKCVENIRLCNVSENDQVLPTPTTTEMPLKTTEEEGRSTLMEETVEGVTTNEQPHTTNIHTTVATTIATTSIDTTIATTTPPTTALITSSPKETTLPSSSSDETHLPSVSPLRRVTYIDVSYGTITDAIRKLADAGFTHALFAFWVYKHVSGTEDTYWDAAAAFADLNEETKKEIVNYAHSKGMKLMLSVGGATETLVSVMALEGSVYGNMAAERAIRGGFDGVDFDLEGFAPSSFDANGVQWLQSVFTAARELLGEEGEVSSAPQAPYFGAWGDYGYNKVEVGLPNNIVDFYFIQYYNQGGCKYDTEETLLQTTGANCWAGDSTVDEIRASGVSGTKLVVGKYAGNAANSGYVSAVDLRQWICDARKNGGEIGGWGVWEYATDSSFDEWLNAAKMGAC